MTYSLYPKGPKKKAAITAIAVLAVAAVTVLVVFLFNKNATLNYAEETAKPLEIALSEVGVTKQCSRGDRGRGSDNDMPWYYAIYEVPGNRETAAKTVSLAAKNIGFTLVDDSDRANPEDNLLLADRTSKKSTYADLGEGNIVLMVDVYGSHTFTGAGDQFCTVSKRSNPSTDRTTIQFTINLPPYKR